MKEHCAQCLTSLPPGASHEAPRGDLLCAPCYFALWGPTGLLTRKNGRPQPAMRRRSQWSRSR
jgi:hypothetical protein